MSVAQNDALLDSIMDRLKEEPPALLLVLLERLSYGSHVAKITTAKRAPFFDLLDEDTQRGIRRGGRANQAEATSKVQLLLLNTLAKWLHLKVLESEDPVWDERKKLFKEIRKQLRALADEE
jgi:hypothetical protein